MLKQPLKYGKTAELAAKAMANFKAAG